MTINAYTEDDPRLQFVPLAELATPPVGTIEHVTTAWWAVHPDKGAVFWRRTEETPSGPWLRGLVPQYNYSKVVASRLFKQMYPWAQIKQIPSAFYRANV